MTKINLKVKDPVKFTNFLKKFSVIETSLLLEIEDGFLKAKTHTPEKSVVKYSSIQMNEIFSEIPEINSPIKIGIINVLKFSTSCNFFGANGFDLIIEHENVDGKNVATSVILKNEILNINFQCASLKLFTYISEDILSNVMDTSTVITEFTLPKDLQTRLTSLFQIDTEYSKITFIKKDNIIRVKGKTFDLKLIEDKELKSFKNVEFNLFKHQYVYLDKEDTQVYICDGKIIFDSNESTTKLSIGETN